MSWNYRVVRDFAEGGLPELSGDFYSIREVYYDDEGKIESWTSDPIAPFGETRVELDHDHAAMARAFSRPVVDVTGEDAVEAS